ncbi:nitrogen fixation protein NifZ [Paraburkholderia lycopersici]|uniref:Nitrogen fixation protein NifZ n=1 Tax=Paraburkholderia lycopersici TaxID=416944 RepID=A0A1G6P9C8_9BURK|nr:nitrogen fixation protein NifZ [Paraburkholderia lycopersici]SDC75965.1 nitrogen fixation protein NifZ [Paraburkholderia lycopersici]
MGDISRDDDAIEIAFPPRFGFGERVIARSVIRNDGTYTGKDIGEVLVNRGDVGYVVSINTFLQQFYIYAVDFVESGCRVGMRAKELCTLDNLPEDVLAGLGERAAALGKIGAGVREADEDAGDETGEKAGGGTGEAAPACHMGEVPE